jgi:hypothetical protein
MCSRTSCIEKDCKNTVGCCSMVSLELDEIEKKIYPEDDDYNTKFQLLCGECVIKRLFSETYFDKKKNKREFEMSKYLSDYDSEDGPIYLFLKQIFDIVGSDEGYFKEFMNKMIDKVISDRKNAP